MSTTESGCRDTDVTVIIVSGLLHQANVRRAREVGADAYIGKPFDEDELMSVVYVALDGRRGKPSAQTPTERLSSRARQQCTECPPSRSEGNRLD